MAQVDTVRPVSVNRTGAATSVPSGTLAAVTSDDSDATYVDLNLADTGEYWSLRLGSHTPPANHQRHRVRARIRIRTNAGTATEDIDIGRGALHFVEYDTVPVTASFVEQATGWYQSADFNLGAVGALSDLNTGGGWMAGAAGGATELRTSECYVDIDCRLRPDFSPEIRDNAGVDQSGGVVTDTNQPDLYFGTPAYDGLPPLNWSVTLNGTTIDSGSGAPPTEVNLLNTLPDGSYTAVFTVRSTIRGADPFEHVQTLTFDVANEVPPPSPPLVTVVESAGGYLVSWENPGGQAWDNDYVVAEVWRSDCTGSQRIATVPNGLNGSYLDLAIPQLDPLTVQTEDGCEVQTEPCDITYSVRYWGYVSTFVELPDTIPSDLILGWPSTAASIPSGWSRVTALDGFYPRGASGTGAPTTTGGSATHNHTTPGHVHAVGAHSHSLGGNTGTSNSSTTSARFNGASQSQADQPHSHTRPSATGSRAGQDSGSASPGTSTPSNIPPTRDVIWISSDGAQANYPVGVLGWATESVSGWTADATSAARFLRGAAAAGDGGAVLGGTHTHTINAHSHTGYTHDHTISNTSLSNPLSSQEAGFGSSTPRWLPRHTHPMDVISTGTGSSTSVSGGTSGSASLEPPNRRLSVLANTEGGTQTRIIGLYMGAVVDLDPLLTLCDGSGGTPDMRTWFARDAGSDSVNSTGGTSVHTHSTGNHTHDIGSHTHEINVNASNTGSFEAPSFGDLGDSPTTNHIHTSGDTASASPSVFNSTSGTTGSSSHIPVYKEAHFVRLDGTISGGPLPVPELKVSDFATATVPSLVHGDDLDRLSNFTDRMAVATDRSHVFPRLVADSVPLDGGLHSVSTTLAGEDMTLVIAVEGLPAIDQLEELLRSERVYFSPIGGTPGWYAPSSWTVRAPVSNVKVLQVTMVRQPWPDTDDPGVYL